MNRLDDTCLAIRPDIKPFKSVQEASGDGSAGLYFDGALVRFTVK